MQAVVFIPGIMGSKLFAADNEELWPPEPLETQFGYKRVDKLLEPDVRAGKIIRKVLCFDFYGSMLEQLDDLGFTRGGADGKRRYEFAYDWRLDLETTADALAAQLDQVASDGADQISLIAHSMGGLVSRLVLETGRFDDRPWFGKITLFAALAVPHLGAPLALARVLGIDSTLGISGADFRKIGNDRRYPSGYQLLPAPGEAACWDQANAMLEPLDIFDSATAQRLGLDPVLLDRCRFVHDSLARGRPPVHVRYFYFAGTGHETPTRVNVLRGGGVELTRTPDAGDGTVPMWSALPRVGQKQVVVNEHAAVFRGRPFKAVFSRLLGGGLDEALESAVEAVGDTVTLSVATPVLRAGKPFELVMVPDAPQRSIAGTLRIVEIDLTGAAVDGAGQSVPIAYAGPEVAHLRLQMDGLEKPGHYRIDFQGSLKPEEPLVVAVAKLDG